MVNANCPECHTEIRLRPEPSTGPNLSYYCAVCEKPVRLDLDQSEDSLDTSLGRPAKVLVVDDTETVADFAAELLRRQGYTVLVAGDGESSLDLIRDERPDVVLLDLVLPGMNGFDVLRALRDEGGPRPQVLVMSGELRCPEDAAKAQALGAAGFILKPVLRDTLVFRVESVLA